VGVARVGDVGRAVEPVLVVDVDGDFAGLEGEQVCGSDGQFEVLSSVKHHGWLEEA